MFKEQIDRINGLPKQAVLLQALAALPWLFIAVWIWYVTGRILAGISCYVVLIISAQHYHRFSTKVDKMIDK
jgi:hypothetical protein